MTIFKVIRRSRFLFWLSIAYLKRHPTNLSLFVLGLLLVIFTIFKISNNYQSSYVEGIVGSYTVAQIPPRITKLVSSGLVILDKSGVAQPGLAQKWEVQENGQKFVFTLKPGLKWQDDSDLKSSDIAVIFEGVNVTYPDDKTIIFSLKEPFSPFPALLSRPVFKKDTVIGTGHYKIDKILKKNDLVTELDLSSNDSRLPKISFHFYQNDYSALIALKLGEVQTISNLTNAQDLKDWNNLVFIQKIDLQKYIAVFFNNESPDLSQKEIRVALNQSINREHFQELAFGPISPNSWAYNNNLKKFNYDPKKTKKTISEHSKTEFKLRVGTTAIYESLAKQIADDWSKIGVKAQIQVVSNPSSSNGFDIIIQSQDIPLDPDQYTLWHSTQKKTNKSKFSDPKIDKLLEDGRKITETESRKQKYLDFQRFLVEDSPAAFLFYPNQYFVYYKNVSKSMNKIADIYPDFKSE